MQARSAAWNPWMKEGRQARMGYIDLFVDTHPSARMTVEFFKNNEQSPYLTKSVDLLPNLFEVGSVSSVSQANPGVVVSHDHGLSTGDVVYIYGIEGMQDVNGLPLTVTVVTVDSFSIGIDTSSFNPYKRGGVITKRPFSSTKVWKRIHTGGSGYQHRINVTSSGKDQQVNVNAFMPWFRPVSVRPF